MPETRLIVEVDGRRTILSVAASSERQVLSDVLAERGFGLNTRCGKRGLCRGCVVEVVEAKQAAETFGKVSEVRSCQIRLEHLKGEKVVRIPRHARLEAAAQVSDSFALDMSVTVTPSWTVVPGVKDLAVAIDVGTTTVAVALVDLVNGEVLARAGEFNAQIRFGDNVVTRIVAAADPAVRRQMQQAVLVETIAPLIAKVCQNAGSAEGRIVGGMVAGNTTMLHLLVGEDPAGMGTVPFTPRFLESRVFLAGKLGSGVSGVLEELPLTLLPGFSAYVGADLAAGVYATGMMYDETPSLLVDIGTNGEIVLQAGGKLYGCATAAGPAFEGSGLLAGTRAQDCAISHVEIEAETIEFILETIGGGSAERAPGLCGTAYVDFMAVARAAGLLLSVGRFDPNVWATLPAARKSDVGGGRALRVAGDLCISEADIAQLLQAKAAIGAGIETLLRVAGLKAVDVGKVYLAGGFGLFIDVGHAIAIDLLPGFRVEQVHVVGNASLGGAVLAALEGAVVTEIEALRERLQVVELNHEPSFEDAYLDHLRLP